MNRAIPMLAVFILLKTSLAQHTENRQIPVYRVPPETSEKLLCGEVPSQKSDGSGSSAQAKTEAFCGPVPSPVYPALAKENKIQGSVVLGIMVGTDGKVKSVRVISGHPLLAPAAIEAVRKWKYKPYYVNHQPKQVETSVVVRFRLDDNEIWKEYAYPESGFAVTLPSDPHPHDSTQMLHGTAYSVILHGGIGLSLHTMSANGKCTEVLSAEADHAKHRMVSGTAESNGFKALSVKEVSGAGYKGYEFLQQLSNGKYDYERWICSADRLFVFVSAWDANEQQPTEVSRIVDSFRVLTKQ